jgi:hypothetical protein
MRGDGSSSLSDDSDDDGDSEMSYSTVDDEEIASLKMPPQIPPALTEAVRSPDTNEQGNSIFTYFPGTTIAGIAISGPTLGLTDSVSIDGVTVVDFDIIFNTRIEARLPSDIEETTLVKVISPGGTSNSIPYTHTHPAIITKLTPDRDPRWGGNTVVISGRKLVGTIHVIFRHMRVIEYPAISFDIVSDTQINAVAPTGLVRCMCA